MNILEAHKIEDCLDGSRVYQYRFSEPWTSVRLQRMHDIGALQYFPHFPRPFFRLRTETGLQITGIGEEPSCRVVYPSTNQAQLKRELETWFESGNNPPHP